MKKMICSLLTAVVVLSIPFTSLAASKENEKTMPSKIVAIREDIPQEEAIKDSTFYKDKAVKSEETVQPRAVTWNVWGDAKWETKNNVFGATPIGYSEHKSGDTVLETYHYTRTYLSEIFKRGDSGRVWGNYTVKATGTFLDDDVWTSYTHVVKYGTES